MRWNKVWNNGDTRTKCRFLILPKRIYKQWRWLEMATWTEHYYDGWWFPDQWVDQT